MDHNNLPEDHPKILNKTGILLINLGTPDGYDHRSVRRYLKEFLSDYKVIEVKPFIWQIILNLFILPFRPKATGANYKKIWMHDINESPLRYYTKAQAEKLQQTIKGGSIVEYAMRYGNPSIKDKVNLLLEQGCTKILFVPLYPQYCAATTATVNDKISDVLKDIRWQPITRVTPPYHDDPLYIEGLVVSVKEHLKSIDFKPDAILASYHGIPQEYFDKGDPYPCFCRKTHRLFSEELIKEKINIPTHISFQSRFGPREWIRPYTEDVLGELVANGVKNLLVITPGFSADCIETLEEVDMQYRNEFIVAGGKNFSLVPCLNDSDQSIKLLDNLVKQNL